MLKGQGKLSNILGCMYIRFDKKFHTSKFHTSKELVCRNQIVALWGKTHSHKTRQVKDSFRKL